ncbi:MAG: pentapeptide repeat-containing protein [Treponema sp.]|nr:pentapeptide repeat-containing protein [Candidatus Treponema equi]
MFTSNKCQCPECKNAALSTIKGDDIVDEPGYCFSHIEDKDAYLEKLKDYIMNHEKIVGLNACGITVHGLDLSGKKFFGCNFQHVHFTNVHAENIMMRMCMMDSSTFSDCDFINSNIMFSSFCGAKLVHLVLTGSDLIHNNFNGITSYQCSFDNSDLYNSRFIKAILMNTSMQDCNLKKTIFYNSARENVSFKLSNTREALLNRNKGGLVEDFSAADEGETL